MDLRLLVERFGCGFLIGALRSGMGAPRFLERFGPRALHLHNLCPMHLAGAGEGNKVRLVLRTTASEQLSTRACYRAQIPADRPRSRCSNNMPVTIGDSSPLETATMVSSRRVEPSFDLPLPNSNSPLLMARTRHQVRVIAMLPDLDDAGCGGEGRLRSHRIPSAAQRSVTAGSRARRTRSRHAPATVERGQASPSRGPSRRA